MKAMLPTRSGRLFVTAAGRTAAALALLCSAAFVSGIAGCSSKMEDKDCTKLKIESFDIVNKAQHCNNDADCKASSWPDCGKPLSTPNADEIKKRGDAFRTGQCEDTKTECTDATAIYCKQGLCARKEKGSPENPGGTAPGDIILK